MVAIQIAVSDAKRVAFSAITAFAKLVVKALSLTGGGIANPYVEICWLNLTNNATTATMTVLTAAANAHFNASQNAKNAWQENALVVI